MKQSLLEFWHFLQSPKLLKINKDKKMLKRDFLTLFLLNVLFAIVLMLVYELFLKLKLIKEYDSWDVFKELGIFWGLLTGVLFAPLLEEYLFRWHLRKRSVSIYFWFLSIAVIVMSNIEDIRLNVLIFTIGLGVAVFSQAMLKKQGQTKQAIFWHTFYPFLFYFSALVFGFVHMSNIKGLTLEDPSFLFYISSQIVGGLTMGYLRVKYGLIYSILFHACFNGFALGLALLFI
ncbi:type II CAAX prenyl endopeptidase Rce1 family protein [Pedobacter sp. Hv1]|uniref:CPBP family glutamic-type intramembrane protease n=1 Tax=Pedobacter sp. Hv1 TaxID=1740090 RepID=UPI000AB4B176|nr:CPBP family glutamic-type intramembrane protease [Pedobacter sp. Hv1]